MSVPEEDPDDVMMRNEPVDPKDLPAQNDPPSAATRAAAVAAVLAIQFPLAIAQAFQAHQQSMPQAFDKGQPPMGSLEQREAALAIERVELDYALRSERMRKAAADMEESPQAKLDFNKALADYKGCAPVDQGADPLPATTAVTFQRAPDVTACVATSDAARSKLMA
jgi:hypothetical protein